MFVMIISSVKKLFFTKEKTLFTDLMSMILVKKMIKKAEEEEEEEEEEKRFQLSNSCWICDKLFDVGDEKVRDHCHIKEKYRGAAHWSCNINLKLSKKISVIFHNLRGYDSHLIIKKNK